MSNKEELLIENQRVDLYEGGKITRTMILNDLGTITSKQSTYSQTIKIPRTANNIKIFQGLGIAGNTSQLPYDRLRCDYLYNGIPVFHDGYAIISSVTPTTYNLTIYNGIMELGEALKDLTLNDLDLSDLTHTYSVDEYQNIINDEDSNFQYSIITDNLERQDDGYVFGYGTSTYNLNETFPFIKGEYIFNEIIKQAGFEINGDLFDDDLIYNEFKSEYVSLTEGFIMDIPTETISTLFSDISTSPVVVEEGFEGNNLDPFFRTDTITNTLGSTTTNGIVTLSPTSFTTNSDGIIRIDLTPNYNIIHGEYIWIRLLKNGEPFSGALFNDNSNDDVVQPMQFYAEAGDVYTWVLESKSEEGLKYITFNRPTVGQWLEFEFSFRYDIRLNSSNAITISGDEMVLGDTKQLDFVKDIVSRYGLLLYKNDTNNIITTKNVNNLLSDRAGAIDYTSKLNDIKSEEFTNSYAQENYFKYKYGDNPNTEVDTSGFYDGSFILNNKLATTEKTIFTSIFEILNENPFQTSYFNDSYFTYLSLKHNLLAFDTESGIEIRGYEQ
jgi:hypothetical protein